ncbi:hypothetical protein I316_07848 [Kwoniella heveanensis BCC8398]|uniref:Alpha-galactosidase n=1 Tax=Kwoniella heveanensis BCC8398 TaxID=1296120 RepID=A0A1B9GHJ9_9TREE|nr:hypothetical protein I316_07848 [Kwoniella heveanensis BCC8398]
MFETRLIEVALASGEASGYRDLHLEELDDSSKWIGWAYYRIAPTWIEARPLESLSHLSTDLTAHLLLLRDQDDPDRIVCVYPVSTETALVNIVRSDDGLRTQIRRAGQIDAQAIAALVVGTAMSASVVDSLMAAIVDEARAYIKGVSSDELEKFSEDRAGSLLDGVGFCTWSSLGEDIHPNQENMSELLTSLIEHNMPIQSFILDDGWHNQKTYASGDASPYRCKTGPEDMRGTWQLRGLYDFDAHARLGENGVKKVVEEAKRRFGQQDGVKGEVNVGVWLALTGGYWDGICPDSPLIGRYNCKPYPVSRDRIPGMANVPFTPGYLPGGKGVYWLPPPEESLRFWTDWFVYLKAQGVDFLKVDNQGSLSLLDGVEGVECQHALWKNMVAASDQVFGKGNVIHCMSHHETMWGGVQGLGKVTNGERFVWRNSDDFGLIGKKDNPDQQHIFTNLSNALLTAHLAMVLDADMFMSQVQNPVPHALLRALYPGPLLLSDRPGEHDVSLLWRLIAKDASGRARVVKTTHPAVPLAHRSLDISVIGMGDGRGMFAAAPSGHGTTLGVWNVRDDEDGGKVLDTLTSVDIVDALGDRLSSSQSWLIAQTDLYRGGIVAAQIWSQSEGEEELAKIQLERMGATSFWLTQLQTCGNIQVAVLGLIDQFAGLTAIEKAETNEGYLTTAVRCEGVFGFVVAIEEEPKVSISINDQKQVGEISKLDNLKGNGLGGWLVQVRIGGNIVNTSDVWKVRAVF